MQLALRPLRHFADFGGRSTRGELFHFAILVGLVGVLADTVDLFLTPGSSGWAIAAAMALAACPALALGVRRLHDAGWSGWWILPALPSAGFAMWNEVQRLLNPFVAPPPHFPSSPQLGLAAGGLGLAVAILLLLDDDPEPNRYGDNPRYEPVGEPA